MKYTTVNDQRIVQGRPLYRIKALKDFADVKAGDYGGWVQSLNNLDQNGDCWIYDNAYAMDMSRIKDNAKLKDNSAASGFAHIMDEARLVDTAEALGHCKIYGKALISNNARVFGDAEVFDAIMRDSSKAHKNAWVCKGVILSDTMEVTEKTTRTPIYIHGIMYNATFMDSHINFNCITKSVNEWLNITDEELEEIDGRKAVLFRKRYHKFLVGFIHDEASNY
jgi:hypothetical protein